MGASVDVANVCSLLAAADKLGPPALRAQCMSFAHANLIAVMATDAFKALKAAQPDLALEMFEVSEKYPGKEKSTGRPNLPINKDLRRAINIASCDRQLLVIAHQLPKETIEILSKIAWGDQHIGQFAWEITSDENEFPGAGMGNPKPGIFIGNPDEFGLKLNWLKTLSPNAKEEAILSALAEVSKTKRASEKSSRQHVARGKRLSKSWESEIPNTDPQIPPPNRRN